MTEFKLRAATVSAALGTIGPAADRSRANGPTTMSFSEELIMPGVAPTVLVSFVVSDPLLDPLLDLTEDRGS